MKGKILTLPDCSKNLMGTLEDESSNETFDFEKGYFDNLKKEDLFEYATVEQLTGGGGGDKRILAILKKKLPPA